jgi:hypothetical protein
MDSQQVCLSFNTLLFNEHRQSVFVIFSSKNPLSASEEAVGKTDRQ